MHIVKQKQANVVDADQGTTVYEYLMGQQYMSGATAVIDGRYPKKGFAANIESKRLILVLSGEGYICIEKEKTPIEIGDCIFIDAKEKFYWEGSLTLFTVSTPAFNPKQHIIYD